MSAPTGRVCRSSSHPVNVEAVAVGVFDVSHVNGHPPEPDSAYCLSCGSLLLDAGYFTPDSSDQAATLRAHIETVEALIRAEGPRR